MESLLKQLCEMKKLIEIILLLFGIPYFIGETCNDVIEVFSEVAVEPTATDKEFIKIITATLNS